ncbi:hypothetical protein NQ318_018112 [Aromia moschata]|uniref:C2H2-type domain-containing protein n=1 Tax=Aromia moschata TaxID=1265417 RepID=A0AAV8ZD91_9CUCU|nr:hypothetical protein NQ318_018112 [Aromia moschata]
MNTEEVAALSDEIVSKFKEMEIILRSSCTPREREIGMKQVKAHIRLCNKAIRSAHLSVGVLRKLQTNISHLKRFSKVIKPLNYTGAGSVKEKRSDRVRWEEIVSAFKSRVRTGVIINLKHKDIQQFFNDSFYLFKSRIINAIKKIHMLKVNTCFCAEFIRKSGDTDIIEKKYFNTKNKVIDEGTDLKNWFEVNVKDCILNDLSEFSESGSGWALNEIINLELVMESHPTLNCRIKLQKNELVLMLKIRMKLVLLGVSLVPFIPLKKIQTESVIKKYFCDRCLNYFTSQDKLNDHVEYCEKLNDCKIEFSRRPIY